MEELLVKGHIRKFIVLVLFLLSLRQRKMASGVYAWIVERSKDYGTYRFPIACLGYLLDQLQWLFGSLRLFGWKWIFNPWKWKCSKSFVRYFPGKFEGEFFSTHGEWCSAEGNGLSWKWGISASINRQFPNFWRYFHVICFSQNCSKIWLEMDPWTRHGSFATDLGSISIKFVRLGIFSFLVNFVLFITLSI